VIDLLKKKSIFAYLTISLLIIIGAFTITVFIQDQRNSGNTINISGKQRMIVERLALLSNNYFYDSKKKEIKKKILLLLNELQENQNYIKNLNNSIANNILYDPGYQYDNLLNQYSNNVEKFIQKPTYKLLKIINYTDESILNITNTLVTLLAHENDKKITIVIDLIIILTVFLILTLYFIYKKITLASIKETKKSIDKLDKQKSFMSAVLKNSAHAIIVTDINGTITLFNKKAQEMLGYTEEEMIFQKTPEVFHLKEEVVKRAKLLSEEFGTDIKPGFRVFVEKTIRNLPNIDEWTYVTKDGNNIIVRLGITAIKDSNSIIIGFIGIAEDITHMKQDELKIQEYIHLIDKNIITSSTDLYGRIIYTSEAFCEISGYTKDELIGKSHSIVRHPDMSKEFYKDMWNHLSNNKEWSGEIKNQKKMVIFIGLSQIFHQLLTLIEIK